MGNLKQIAHHKANDELISILTYTYDKTGHRQNQYEDDGTVTTWTYDSTYQLTNEHRAGGPDNTSFNITYTYDNAGNRPTRNDGAVITTYTYSNANRLLTESNNGLITTYTHDAAGNRTGKQTPDQLSCYYDWNAAAQIRGSS